MRRPVMSRVIAGAAVFVSAMGLGSSIASADDRLAATAAKVAVYGNTHQFTPPIYDIYAGTYAPLTAWQNTASPPYAPFTAMLSQIPTLSYLVSADGTDGEMVINDRVRGQTIEFWKAAKTNGKWGARWGGRAANSAFTSTPWGRIWPTPNNAKFGVQASGLAFTPGVITVAELRAGAINHAIHMQVPNSCRSWQWPAQRTDGNAVADGTFDCYKYGTAYKLDPSFVVPTTGRRVMNMIMAAAKKYGVILTDATHYGLQIRFENWKRPWSPWGAGATPIDPYRDPTHPELNLFQCPPVGGNQWACFPDKTNMFGVLTKVLAPNTKSFMQALREVDPATGVFK